MKNEYNNFVKNIYYISGIDLSLYKQKQMKRRIDSLISRKDKKDYVEYYNLLINDKKEYQEFMNYITINVSEFFRNAAQWDVLKKDIIPNIKDYKKGLKIWSAACSTGEEVYTIALILKELNIYDNSNIISTDLDEQALNKAVKGRYTPKSIEKVPDKYLQRYFIKDSDGLYVVKDELKRNIKFEQLNLLRDRYPQNIDLIVCRNVLIYFTEDVKNMIYQKFNQALNDDGILFVGSTEQIITPQNYNFMPVRSFFYKKSYK
ncbi:MAG: protein-glutamate O-methyltransferase CheR [Clostridia bacterium]|nr:protein-glutamate O-methyltransferase CheR [Clostridia bacterium]